MANCTSPGGKTANCNRMWHAPEQREIEGESGRKRERERERERERDCDTAECLTSKCQRAAKVA